MSKPTTALLIPCYNAEKYLENLRKQVDGLDPKFDELLLVDDASTDRTVAKAQELGFDIKQLETNRGPGGARNALLGMANSEWIHFLDADDEIATGYLAHVLPLADKDTDVVLSGCDFIGLRDRGLWRRWIYHDDSFAANALAAAIAQPVFLHSSLIRRAKALEAGGFDEVRRCYEDGDFHVRLAAAGARFRCIHNVLAFSLRHHEGSGSSELYCAECRLDFLKDYCKYIGRIPETILAQALAECAAQLDANGNVQAAEEAFRLAFNVGWKGPESKHPALRALKAIPSKALKKRLFLRQYAARIGR